MQAKQRAACTFEQYNHVCLLLGNRTNFSASYIILFYKNHYIPPSIPLILSDWICENEKFCVITCMDVFGNHLLDRVSLSLDHSYTIHKFHFASFTSSYLLHMCRCEHLLTTCTCFVIYLNNRHIRTQNVEGSARAKKEEVSRTTLVADRGSAA